MAGTTPATALEREHGEIDSGIETYLAGQELGSLLHAMAGLRRMSTWRACTPSSSRPRRPGLGLPGSGGR